MSEFLDTVKDIHFNPTAFFEGLDPEGLEKPARFAAKVGLLFAGAITVLGLLSTLTGNFSPVGFIGISLFLIITLPIVMVAGASIQSALVHLPLYIMGSRGFDKTCNAVVYPVAATGLWSWIPIISIIAGLYNVYLQIKGVRILHGTSLGKAFIAVTWPILLVIVLVILSLVIGAGSAM